jgi:hypothetical protein
MILLTTAFLYFKNFLLEGEVPWLDFVGIFFGHLYHHLKTTGMLEAPASLKKWYRESPSAQGIRDRYKDISSDFEVVE